MVKLFAFVISFFVSTGCALAQMPIEMCTRLAETITAGQSTVFTEQNLKALQRYVTCETGESSTNAALGIAIKVFNVSGSFSQDQKKKMCSSDLKALNIDVSRYQSTKIIFTETLPIIEACIRAASRSWNIEVARIHQDAISLSISNLQPQGGRLDNVDIIPSGAMSCTPMPTFPQVVDAKAITMTCIRETKQATIEGVTVTSAPDVTVNLRLAEAPFPIKLAGYRASAFESVRQELAALRGDFTRLRDGLGSWPTESYPLANQVGEGTERVATQCPPGQYATGIKWWGAGGRFCVGCLSGIQVICKPLNNR